MTFDQLLRGNASKLGCDAIPQLALKDQPRTHVRELMVDNLAVSLSIRRVEGFRSRDGSL